MLYARIIILMLICTVMSRVQAAALDAYLIPTQRFIDWSMITRESSDAALTQVWQKPLPNTPKHADGYVMVAYSVTTHATPAAAAQQAGAQLQKVQYNSYLGKGYTVESQGWVVQGLPGAIFILSGLAHDSMAGTRAQMARIYTLAFAREEQMILLQVREVSSARELKVTERVLNKAGGRELANALGSEVIARWLTQPTAVVPPVSTEPEPIPGTEPTPTPPNPSENPVAVTPIPPEPFPPALPEDPTPLLEGTRWATPDKLLVLTLPNGWTVKGKLPYVISGQPEATLRLYPYDDYQTAEQRDAKLQSFVRSQRAIAAGQFVEEPFSVDGAVGKRVHYVNDAGQGVYAHYFGKSARLWRLDVYMERADSPLPEMIRAVLASITLP